MNYLEKLKKSEIDLQHELSRTKDEICREISSWPIVIVSSTDSQFARPSGDYHINTDSQKAIDVYMIHSASEHDEVELKSGDIIPLTEYFSEEEIDSMRDCGLNE